MLSGSTTATTLTWPRASTASPKTCVHWEHGRARELDEQASAMLQRLYEDVEISVDVIEVG